MLMFGTRLKELRIQKGLTQQQLGDLVGVTKVSICCYEKGRRTPTMDTMIDIATVLNVDYGYFLGRDDFAVTEDKSGYGVTMAREEIDFILELRKNVPLHEKIVKDPKRYVDLIAKKL